MIVKKYAGGIVFPGLGVNGVIASLMITMMPMTSATSSAHSPMMNGFTEPPRTASGVSR